MIEIKLFLLLICISYVYSFVTTKYSSVKISNLVLNNVLENMRALDPDIVAVMPPKTREISELPNTFDDSIDRAVSCSLDCILSGQNRIKIEFDTSIGDMTYTTLKNAMPFMKAFANKLSKKMDLYPLQTPFIDEGNIDAGNKEVKAKSEETKTTKTTTTTTIEASSDNKTDKTVESISKTEESENNNDSDEDKDKSELMHAIARLEQGVEDTTPTRSMRIFFPDMGAAALARRDWKMGTFENEVPACVFSANIQNDPVEDSDEVVVLLCPLSYEVDYVKRVVQSCSEMNVPCIMINPALVSGDQGFGVRARNLRSSLINTFTTAYKLKTMANGAIVREYPKGYSVWVEDDADETGYTLMETFKNDPPREVVDELYDSVAIKEENEENNNGGAPISDVVINVAKEFGKFFDGLSKL